jgi:hypothetical protein
LKTFHNGFINLHCIGMAGGPANTNGVRTRCTLGEDEIMTDSSASIVPSDEMEGWTTIDRGIWVAAPLDCVESLLIDFRQIYPTLDNIQLDETFPDIGGKLCYSTRLGTLAKLEITLTMLEWKRGFLFGDLAIEAIKLSTGGLSVKRSAARGSVMWLMTVEEGGTRVTARYQYEQPSHYFEQIMEQRVVRHMVAGGLTKTLLTIKTMAEARVLQKQD